MRIEYTFITGESSEKSLIKKLEENLKILANGNPQVKNTKLKKRKQPVGQTSLDPDEQYFYEYDYWFNNRYLYSIFLQLYPNTDINKKTKFNIDGAGWNLYLYFSLSDNEQKSENDILRTILADLPFEYKLIKIYLLGEDRL